MKKRRILILTLVMCLATGCGMHGELSITREENSESTAEETLDEVNYDESTVETTRNKDDILEIDITKIIEDHRRT